MLDDDTLLDRALAALTTPLTRAELATALDLAPHGHEAEAVIDELLIGRRAVDVGDGRIALAAGLLDGLVSWHRLEPVEAGTRRLAFGVDGLIALDLAPDPFDVLVGDVAVEVDPPDLTDGDIDRGPSVQIPDDWAPHLRAGDLVALVLDGDRVRLRSEDEVPPRIAGASDEIAVGALASALTAAAAVAGAPLTHLRDRDRPPEDQWVLDLSEAGPLLLADHRGALRGLDRLPLREAVARVGLQVRGGVVAGPAVDRRQLETYLVGRIVFPDAPWERSREVEACGIAYGAIAGPETDTYDERATARALDQLLRSPTVADAMVRHLRLVNATVVGVAERRIRTVRRKYRQAPGPAWVHASLLLRQARAHDARRVLEGVASAIGVDGAHAEWQLALECAAHLRLVAGDLSGAIEVHRRVGADVLADRLDTWDPPPPDVGRNDRCPCGSGAKAKRCCLGSPTPLPLAGRTGLLWEKITGWALGQQILSFMSTMMLGRLTAVYGLDPCTGFDAAFDAVLLEGGGVGAVLDEVGGLLPDDEQDLAVRWRHGRHRLWHVQPSEGASPVWRDVISGERAVVAGRLDHVREVSGLPPVGAHVVAALLPGPLGHHLVGAPVAVVAADVTEVRDRIAAGPDVVALVVLVADLHRRAATGGDPGGLSDAA
ncbi:hypothetical protein HC251_24190 [Iamia sp. SCSIO 61187]|uniref:SEC-C metal-binding domain-containing protein n=1 Tax=Iamia sp. SCSIO 61187 TaxID=2722752 RepID=UPI001C62E28F|nr:SEC-C metal-binding domain-containing protein [Iamia sp. SCSIO 61187]QYG95223.1 hypothetical protein HC251_24190 [Iamia sp. SCSIO 61187]